MQLEPLIGTAAVQPPGNTVGDRNVAVPTAPDHAIIVSDADVKIPPGYLKEAMTLLQRDGVGLVNSFYRFANPQNRSMWIEAIAVNCDFWSQVCQSNSMRPMRFALGAAMGLRLETLRQIGGFRALVDYIADDNRLGLLVDATGQRIVLTNAVVDCFSGPMTFRQVWDHQVRWARTIRVCEPVPFFFSVLTHCSLWGRLLLYVWVYALLFSELPLLFWPLGLSITALLIRIETGLANWRRLTDNEILLTRNRGGLMFRKDSWAALWWLLAFLGNTIVWRGRRHRILKQGRLETLDP